MTTKANLAPLSPKEAAEESRFVQSVTRRIERLRRLDRVASERMMLPTVALKSEPVNGELAFDGSKLYIVIGGVYREIALV